MKNSSESQLCCTIFRRYVKLKRTIKIIWVKLQYFRLPNCQIKITLLQLTLIVSFLPSFRGSLTSTYLTDNTPIHFPQNHISSEAWQEVLKNKNKDRIKTPERWNYHSEMSKSTYFWSVLFNFFVKQSIQSVPYFPTLKYRFLFLWYKC